MKRSKFSAQQIAFILLQTEEGTPVEEIPPGEVRTYGDVARAVGSSPRAVGNACSRNPVPIIVACRRIVGANGALGGYSSRGGAGTKRFLLDLETAGTPAPAAQLDIRPGK